MRTCIFCKKIQPVGAFNIEHIFPESIGGNITIKDVCKKCNSYLGHNVDVHLTNHWFIQVIRQTLGITGKSGKVPNPLGKGTLGDRSKAQVRYIIDSRGLKHLYVFPQVTRKILKDGNEAINIKIDKKDREQLSSIINKIIKRSGKTELSPYEIEKIIHRGSDPYPLVDFSIKMDFKQYERSILKIAYELSYYQLGIDYLTDETSKIIKSCIFDNSLSGDWTNKYKIQGTIGLIEGKPRFGLWDNEKNNHIAFLSIVDKKIISYVKIFNIFEGVVVTSQEATKYNHFPGYFLSIDPINRIKRESTLMEEFARIGGINVLQK